MLQLRLEPGLGVLSEDRGVQGLLPAYLLLEMMQRVHHSSCFWGLDQQHREALFCPELCGTQLQRWHVPSSEVRCLCSGVAEASEICGHSHIFALSLPPQLDVVFSKQISLCGFPINTSQGGLVNMDEAS